MTNLEKKLLAVNALIYTLFLVFSYCYVDLNLTLSKSPVILSVINSLQGLGYYNRPIATAIYIVLVIIAFSFFALNLSLFAKTKIGIKYLISTTMLNTFILFFAYPFLSYDVFNYIFYTKIILHYHLSPYTHKALDFPGDDWIRFMRWTHSYSPYGPLWLGYSLIPAMLGFGKFVVTLLFFKLFIGSFHLANSFIIYKILQRSKSENPLFATSFYALNPVFLIEGIANSHNDIVFAAFILSSIYLFIKNKKIHSISTLIVGALLKYISILNLPWLIISYLRKIPSKSIIVLNLVTLTVFTIIFSTIKITVPLISSGSTQVQFQPWYLFWTIPIVALTGNKRLMLLSISICFGAMLRYIPYLYNGDWSQPGTIIFMTLAILVPTFMSILFLIVKKLKYE